MDSDASSPAARDIFVQVPSCAGDCTLVTEADHRIGNQLAALSSYIRLKAREISASSGPPPRENVLLIMSSVDAQIRSIARLHRLLTVQGDRSEAVDLSASLDEVCASFTGEAYKPIVLLKDFSVGESIPPRQVLPICQIVAEAIMNAVKYAYPTGKTGTVTVRSRRGNLGEVIIEIADKGVGLNAEAAGKQSGFGLSLMRRLTQALGAQMELEDAQPGLCVRLVLPNAPT